MDSTEGGRKLKVMLVADEHPGECLGIEVERSSITADVTVTLRRLFANKASQRSPARI